MFRMQHIDQYSIVVLGIPDAQQTEYLEGAFARSEAGKQIANLKRVLDNEPQLASLRAFEITDAAFNLRQNILWIM